MPQDETTLTRRRLLSTSTMTAVGLTGLVGTAANGNGGDKGGGRNPRDVEIETSKRVDSSTGAGVRTARPGLDLFPRTTVLPAHAFEIENVDTGDTLTVRVDSDERPDADAATFFINNPDGSLRGDATELTCWTLTDTGATSVQLETTIAGDSSVFHGGNPGTPTYFDYRVTMLLGNSAVDATSEHLIPIAHPAQFDYTAEDGVLRYSWNGEHLPSDTSRTVSHLFTASGTVPAAVSYDAAADRLVGTIEPADPDEVPHGTYTVAMTVKDPATGWRVISFRDEVEIGEAF